METKETKLAAHPAAAIFPMMSSADFTALGADIAEHGQREAIVMLDGMILDGRNRYESCLQRGIEPEFSELESCDDPVAYVLSANLHRRHLTTSQRAKIAVRVKEMLSADAKERQKASGGDRKSKDAKSVVENLPQPIGKGKARDQAGKAMGVSGRMVDMAQRVMEQGSDDLKKAIEDGDVTVSRAVKVLDQPKEEQLQAATTQRKRRPAKTTACTAVDESTDTDGLPALDNIEFHLGACCRLLKSVNGWLDRHLGSTVYDQVNRLWELADEIEDELASIQNRTEDRCGILAEDAENLKAHEKLVEGLFCVERRDGGFSICLPNLEYDGPYDSEVEAEKQANRYRKQAFNDPTFLDSFYE